MWPQNVFQLDVSFLQHSLWNAGWRWWGKRKAGRLGSCSRAQVEAWLEGCSWLWKVLSRSQDCSAPLLFEVLCCLLCLIFAEKNRHGKKWPYTHCFQGRSTYFCSLGQLVLHWRARRASLCHVDIQPGLLLSAGLMANQISLPGLVCSAAHLAQ